MYHCMWSDLRDNVQEICKKCPTCQITKKTNNKYGLFPENTAYCDPWDVLCVYLVEPYKIKPKCKKE